MKPLFLFLLLFSSFTASGQRRLIFQVTGKSSDQTQELPLENISIRVNFEHRQDFGESDSKGQISIPVEAEKPGDPLDYTVIGSEVVGKTYTTKLGRDDRLNTFHVPVEFKHKPPVVVSKPKAHEYQISGPPVRDIFNKPLFGVRVETRGRKKLIYVETDSSGNYELHLYSRDIDGTDLSLNFIKDGYEVEQRSIDLCKKTLNQGVFLRPLPATTPPPEEKKRINGKVVTTYKPRKTASDVEVRLMAPRDQLYITHTNEKGSFEIERPSRFFGKKDTIHLHFKKRDFQETEKQLVYDNLDSDRQVVVHLERKPYYDDLSPNDLSVTAGRVAYMAGIDRDNLLNNPFFRISFDHFLGPKLLGSRVAVGGSYTYAGLAYQISRPTQTDYNGRTETAPYPISKPQGNWLVQAKLHWHPYNTVRWNYFVGVAQSVFYWDNSQVFVGARQPFMSKSFAFDFQFVYANHRNVPVNERGRTFNPWGNDSGNDQQTIPYKTFNSFYVCASLHFIIPGL